MIALSTVNSYMDSYARLPASIKVKAKAMMAKIKVNPRSAGLHFEKLSGKDNQYSYRVDDKYRIICFLEGNCVILAYVDNHEEAYRWAQKNRLDCDANGVASVYEETTPKLRIQKGKMLSRLSALTDEDLNDMDIQADLWPYIREKIYSKNQLPGIKDCISNEAYEVLELVINGSDREEAMELYRGMTEDVTIDPKFFARPLFLLSEEEILKVGVPAEYIDAVKAIKFKNELIRLCKRLPENAAQNLMAVFGGADVKEIIKIAERGNKPIPDGNILKALANEGTKQNIAVFTDETELNNALDLPLEKWRIFLHPEQRHTAEARFNGPARVLGGAGTGKTIVVVHRAKNLAKQCEDGEMVLVTTYSHTLAEEIFDRIKSICTEKEMERIQVETLDKIAGDYVEKKLHLHIKYNVKESGYNVSPLIIAWQKAIAASGFKKYKPSFYLKEWETVIQGRYINSVDEYCSAPRTGMGKDRIDKKDREMIWGVFEQYKKYMASVHWIDIDWAENLASQTIRGRSEGPLYKHILVDECQDFKAPALRFIRALAGNEHIDDLFFAGDSRQRIYEGKYSLSKCGINVRNRSYRFIINYRTTSEVFKLAMKLQKDYLYDDLDDNTVEKDGSYCPVIGDKPMFMSFDTAEDEIKAVIRDIESRCADSKQRSGICIAARTNDLLDRYEAVLRKNSLEVLRLTAKQSNKDECLKIRLSTMHRVKGMEFDYMYILGVNRGVVPLLDAFDSSETDEEIKAEIRQKEANLLAVAVTRARKNVWVSYFGEPSELLNAILPQ